MGYLTSVVIKDNVCLQELNTTNTRTHILQFIKFIMSGIRVLKAI